MHQFRPEPPDPPPKLNRITKAVPGALGPVALPKDKFRRGGSGTPLREEVDLVSTSPKLANQAVNDSLNPSIVLWGYRKLGIGCKENAQLLRGGAAPI
jgi:hypothetical protein